MLLGDTGEVGNHDNDGMDENEIKDLLGNSYKSDVEKNSDRLEG